MIVRDRRNRPHRHVLRRRVSWWSIGSVGGAFALLALALVSRIPDDAPVAVLAAPPVAAAPAPSDGPPYVLAPPWSAPVADPPDAVVTAPAVVPVAQVVHIAVPAAQLVTPPAAVPDVPEHEARQVVEPRPKVDTRRDVTEGKPDVDQPTKPVSHPQPVVDGDQDGDDTPPQTPPKTTPPSQTPPSQTSPPTDTSGSTTTPPAPPTNTPAPAPAPEHGHAPWDGWQDYWQHYVHGGAHHADPQD